MAIAVIWLAVMPVLKNVFSAGMLIVYLACFANKDRFARRMGAQSDS